MTNEARQARSALFEIRKQAALVSTELARGNRSAANQARLDALSQIVIIEATVVASEAARAAAESSLSAANSALSSAQSSAQSADAAVESSQTIAEDASTVFEAALKTTLGAGDLLVGATIIILNTAESALDNAIDEVTMAAESAVTSHASLGLAQAEVLLDAAELGIQTEASRVTVGLAQEASNVPIPTIS